MPAVPQVALAYAFDDLSFTIFFRDHRRDDGWQKEPASTVLIKNVPEDVIEREVSLNFVNAPKC